MLDPITTVILVLDILLMLLIGVGMVWLIFKEFK